MNRLLKRFEYLEPKYIEEALKMISDYGQKGSVLAGGTDLIIAMKKRKVNPQYIINIKSIPDLDYIRYDRENGLGIGAVTTHSAIADSPVIRDKFSLLAAACNKIGTPQVRNMGTIGGNICKAGPSQDTPPALLVLDAKVKLVSFSGNRIVPIDEFFVGPFKTVLQEAELLTEIQIPTPPSQSAGSYKWLTKVVTVDETLVGVAVLLTCDAGSRVCTDIKIGLGSVAPTPIRARKAENVLRGKSYDDRSIQEAAQVAAEETRPRSRADYRRKMTRVLVREAITEAWQSIQ